MDVRLKAMVYLDFVKRVKAAEGNKEIQMALIDDFLENGYSSQEIIEELLTTLKEGLK